VVDKQVIEQFLLTKTEEAFCALFEAICVRVRRYFLLRGLDAATAEDLTQNVFVKVYRQVGELHNADHFYGWLFAIARNEMTSFWRREQPWLEIVELVPLTYLPVDSLRIEPEVISVMRMMDLLNALEPGERDLVVLRFVEGLSYEELAMALNLPIGTVKWRIFNVRKKIARSFGASPDGKTKKRIN
jgi:RNA polymerase sigma-70 factor (ECF subfamily)